MKYEDMRKVIEEKRPEHTAEALLKEAETYLGELLPGGLALFEMGGKDLPVEDLGGAMTGLLVLMMDRPDKNLVGFVTTAVELACQAVIAKRLEERNGNDM